MTLNPRFLIATALLVASSLQAETTVSITDKVVVADVEGLGAHFGGDTFYDSVILRRRVAENFEGSVNRLHVQGHEVQPEADGLYLVGPNRDVTQNNWYIGAKAHVLNGPDQWTVARVVAIESRPHVHPRQKGNTTFIKLDRPVRWTDEWLNGLLLEAETEGRGQHPWIVERRERQGEVNVVRQAFDEQYTSGDNTQVVLGDVPPKVGQTASMSMDGTTKPAFLRFRAQFQRAAPFQGTWTVKLWARARSGSPVLEVRPTVPGRGERVIATDEWKHYTVKLDLEKPAEGQNPIFMLELRATGGDVLVDVVEAWRDGDGSPDTPWRDGIIQTLKDLKPGTVRYLRNNRDSYLNSILPGHMNSSMRNVGSRKDNFGTHEFYQLCQIVGADPWATLPGTILLEEIDQVMEYHAAPADVGLGKLRAELGQERPWTEVFDKIHLQFGNEVITFFGTGFQGPDYWKALAARVRASKYYDPKKFVLHLNEQGGGLARLFEFHPGFDRGTINGYHIFGLYQDQIERAKDLPGFYDFVYASAWHMWMDKRNNRNWNNLEATRKLGKELSIYEGGNFHSTFSDPSNAPMERINRMNAGKAGGVSAVNSMLILLRHYGARTQQNFNFSQERFSPAGSFGNLPEAIRGWGGIIGMGSDRQRFRPRFLALKTANQVIGGDLVETVHSGEDPTFSVTNRFGAGYGPSRNPEEMTVEGLKRIHSYAFSEGKRRGLILVSNDPRNTQRIKVDFKGEVAGRKAKVWWVDSPNIEDTNEFDWSPTEPSVKVSEKEIDFASGSTVELPPATLMSIEWSLR